MERGIGGRALNSVRGGKRCVMGDASWKKRRQANANTSIKTKRYENTLLWIIQEL